MSTSVSRLMTVWFPDWPAHALVMSGEVDPAHPVAVLDGHRVVARSPVAARAGVRSGMRRRDAEALCPSLVVVAADTARAARMFEPVLRALTRLVPTVEVTEPGQVAITTRGPSRRCGGDAALAAAVDDLLTDAVTGAQWGIGIADGRFTSAVAARRAARHGAPVVVDVGGAAEFLARLPTRALAVPGGLPPDLVDLLGRLGLTRLGEVARVPAPDLLARFGLPGRLAHILATGRDETPVVTAPVPIDATVEVAVDDPLEHVQAVVFRARAAGDALAAALTARALVCTRLVVEIHTDGGERSSRAWYRAGGLSVAAMVERVRWQVEALAASADPESGTATGVVRLRLVPDEVRLDTGRQVGFWGGESEADDTAVRAATRLSALLGPDAVTVPEWQGGRDHPVTLVSTAGVDWSERAARVRPAAQCGPWPGRLPTPSPARRYAHPLPVDLLDDVGRRLVVGGRGGLSGDPAVLVRDGDRRARVVAWAGPWPVEERWWDVRSRRAARLQMVVSDRRAESAHLVEVRDGRWWLVADYV